MAVKHALTSSINICLFVQIERLKAHCLPMVRELVLLQANSPVKQHN